MSLSFQSLLVLLLAGLGVGAVENPIRFNTVGFLPGQTKQASITVPATNFSVIRLPDGKTVFKGKLSPPRTNDDTGEVLSVADFSRLGEVGTYRIKVAGAGQSSVFRIAPDVYQQPYVLAIRAFHLWRCGTAVCVTNAGMVYAHGSCHTNDAWLDFATGRHELRQSVGGWHDAGDYNKYVVNAGVTVGVLLRAWEDFGPALVEIPLQLPQGHGWPPEFLREIKWELDWLLTMQDSDGSVFHKVSTREFGAFVQPEAETTPRYFAPWSSEATANFVAMLAAAARVYEPYDPEYAEQCLSAAERSYAFLLDQPNRHKSDQSKFSTGTYEVGDGSARLWAAAELWATTGREDCLRDLERRLHDNKGAIPARWDYGNPDPLGALTYLFCGRFGRNEALVSLVRSNLMARADAIVTAGRGHGYARPGSVGYGWGYNGQVARQAVLLQAASRFSARPEYFQAAGDAAGFLLGRNVHGRSYVTGVGHQPPMRPHDRASASDELAGPWPGYLVGGPHPKPTDWFDVQDDHRTNEIAINWNAALVYALAWLATAPQ